MDIPSYYLIYNLGSRCRSLLKLGPCCPVTLGDTWESLLSLERSQVKRHPALMHARSSPWITNFFVAQHHPMHPFDETTNYSPTDSLEGGL